MSWPSGVQWEWAIGEFAVLGFLIWELVRLRRAKAATRQRLAQQQAEREQTRQE